MTVSVVSTVMGHPALHRAGKTVATINDAVTIAAVFRPRSSHPARRNAHVTLLEPQCLFAGIYPTRCATTMRWSCGDCARSSASCLRSRRAHGRSGGGVDGRAAAHRARDARAQSFAPLTRLHHHVALSLRPVKSKNPLSRLQVRFENGDIRLEPISKSPEEDNKAS